MKPSTNEQKRHVASLLYAIKDYRSERSDLLWSDAQIIIEGLERVHQAEVEIHEALRRRDGIDEPDDGFCQEQLPFSGGYF